VVPNATVQSTNLGTGATRTVTTGSDGSYTLGLLPLGNYRIKIDAAGFKSEQIPSVTVNVAETTVADAALQVGSQTTEVTVQEQAETVNTTNATLGTVVGSETATVLPLNTRNYTNLLGLQAGANANVFNATTLGKGSTDISVNGASPGQNSLYMDGVSITNSSSNGNISGNTNDPAIGLVEPDAIQEFKVQTSMFDAGFGRNAGASVNVVTKTGTNNLHGSAFEFFRNTVLNSNDFFLNAAGKPRPALDQNQYGGTVGGPIKKDKLFFFSSYQQLWQKNGAAAQGLSNPLEFPIPGTDGIVGDSRGTLGNAADQAALAANLGKMFGSGCGTDSSPTLQGGLQVLCTPGTGQNRYNINPVVLNLLQLKNPDGSYLIPSLTPSQWAQAQAGGKAGLVVPFSNPAYFSEEQYLQNVDYVVNSKNTLSAHYFLSRDPEEAPFGCTNGVCYPDTGVNYLYINNYGNLQLTSIATNNLVNTVKFAVSRGTLNAEPTEPFTDSAGCPGASATVSAGITPIQCNLNQLNILIVTGDFEIGAAGGIPTLKTFDSWVASDEVSWTHGKHTIRFGGDYERDRYDWYFKALSIGSETFPDIGDFLVGLAGCSTPGCSLANPGNTNGTNFSNLSASGNYQSETPPGGLNHAYRDPYAALFIQDDYKLTRKLTVNLGMRWEYLPIMIDAKGFATNINPSYINANPIPGNSAIGCPNPSFSSATDPCVPGSLAGFVVPSNFPFSQFATPAVGGLIQSSHKGFQPNNTPLDDFSPRVGLAWSPLNSNRLTVRSGIGIFRDRSGALNYIGGITQAIPYATPLFETSQQSAILSSLGQPYVIPPNPWTPRTADFTTGLSSNLTDTLTTPNYNKTPTTYEWNLAVQYQFLPTWTVDLGYVGSHSIQNEGTGGIPSYTGQQLNGPCLVGAPCPVPDPAITSGLVTSNTTGNTSLRVPYLGFAPTGLMAFADDYSTKYNAAQVTVRKQLSHGLTLNAAYSWSRTFGSLFAYNSPYVATYEQNINYHPQRLTVTYEWDIPSNFQGFMGKVANGWGVSGVTTVQDGVPLTITNGKGGTIYGQVNPATAQYCSGMGAGNVASGGSDKQRLGGAFGGTGWFNTSAVNCADPPVVLNGVAQPGTGWGDVPPSILLGPGQFNTDLSLIKTTKVGGIREDGSLVFRTEFFNAFNHAQFNNPGTLDVTKGTFGQITSSSVNPRLIQFGLKYIF
jgi:outer membrane receptor protein involved in Fe transport